MNSNSTSFSLDAAAFFTQNVDADFSWRFSRGLIATSVYFGWWRLLRVLSWSQRLGPFILMFLVMFDDILLWIGPLVVLLLSTASAQYVMHASAASLPYRYTLLCGPPTTPFGHFATALARITQGALTSDPDFDCMSFHFEMNEPDFAFVWIFQILFAVIVGLLLVNMLIAKMAKTFDAIWENQGLNHQYMRARTVLTWDEAPLVCSPFTVFSWPLLVIAKLPYVGHILLTGTCPVIFSSSPSAPAAPAATPPQDDALQRGTSSVPKRMSSAKVMPSPAEGAQADLNADGEEQRSKTRVIAKDVIRSLLTSMGVRKPLAKRCFPDKELTSDQITAEVAEWILDHEDEVSQSERWRTQMNRRNAKRFDRIEKKVTLITLALKEMKRSGNGHIESKLSSVQATLEKMEKKLGVDGEGQMQPANQEPKKV